MRQSSINTIYNSEYSSVRALPSWCNVDHGIVAPASQGLVLLNARRHEVSVLRRNNSVGLLF
uniref:Uncharacterized protein n=1 Tax=Arundo donax TaxID=35708 RepID=A0A0A9HGD3_ARUDO